MRIFLILTGTFIIACLVFDHFVTFRRNDQELHDIFLRDRIDGVIGYYRTHDRLIRYATYGNDSLPTIVMLHGSPGSMSYYTRQYSDTLIRDHFRVITLDRPGYGYSGLGDPEPSLEIQADIVAGLIDTLGHSSKPIVISAGSYGVSVACRLAMDRPDLVDGLALTGPSLGPGLETMFWFTPAIETWPFRWFIPRIFRSANTEKLHHEAELRKMLPYWKNIRVPVSFLQGENDDIIDTTNAGFARTHLVNVPSLDIQFVKGREHRLAQFEWPLIRTKILEVYSAAARLQNDRKLHPRSL